MATEIERLAVLIEANTKGYENAMRRMEKKNAAGFKRMSRQVDRLSVSLKKAGLQARGMLNAMGIGTTLTAGALVGLGREAISTGDKIAKVAAKVGLTTDELQELRYAAELTGVAANTLDMAMQRFSRRVGEAANGGGELYKILTANNIALRNTDGTMRSQMDILLDYADLIQRAVSKQEQLTLAFKGLDSEGAALVNTFSRGSAGVKEYMQQAQAAGVVIREDLIKSSVELNDKWTKLSATLKTNVNSNMIGIIGALSDTGSAFDEAIKKADKWLSKIGNSSIWEKLAVGKYSDEYLKSMGLTPVKQDKTTGQTDVPLPRRKPAKPGGGGVIIPIGSSKSKSAVTAATILRDLERQNESLKLQAEMFGKSEGAMARANARQAIMNRLQDSNITMTDEQRATMEQRLAVMEKTINRTDEMNERLQRVEEIGSVMAGNLESAFSSLAESGKLSVKDMVSSMLKDLARLAIQQSVLQPLFGGGSSGGSGLFGSLLGKVFNLQKFDTGTENVPRDMVAQIHKGEMIIPAVQAGQIRNGQRAGGGGFNLGGIHIDARGSTEDAVRMLEQSLPGKITYAIHETFSRDPRFAGSF